MSSIRYEFSDEELNNFKPKLLYLTQSEYGDDWHSTPHYHPFLELLYVFDGKGEFIIDTQAFSLTRGDFVIIINTDKAVLTGDKLNKKLYQHHTGYIGNLKEVKYGTLMAEKI